MRAVECEDSRLEVVDLPTPKPAARQVVIQVTGCGICGSDIHARTHADDQADVLAEAGYEGFMRSNQRVVMGHEFCGEVVEYGPNCAKKLAVGTPVVALPLVRNGTDFHAIGLSASAPGAYAELVVVEESMMLALPNGLPAEIAVLTEPMAIALHAVNRAEVKKRDVAVVIGCGPVGLAVVAMLKSKGVTTVIASDFSSGRRALATRCGADAVVDPSDDSAFSAAVEHGWIQTIPEAAAGAVVTVEKLQDSKIPLPWHVVWRTAERLGVGPKRPIIFECVGIPGIIDDLITTAPLFSRIIVVGVCMQPDRFRPVMAINKEIDLRFVVGYTPLEFRDTLHLLGDGKVNASAVVTGVTGLDGVETAFQALASPQDHAKIIIDPRSSSNTICVQK